MAECPILTAEGPAEWADGYRQAQIGRPWQANPFPPGTEEHTAWQFGWEDARREEEDAGC